MSGAQGSGTPDGRLYRRLIDWTARLRREGPMLEEALRLGPGVTVLDLGCGAGDHARWLAARAERVVAVDRSPDMLAAARDAQLPANVELVAAPIEELPALVTGPFDSAICLGNTLPHLLDAEALAKLFGGVAARLRPGGRFLVQLLNYEAILAECRRVMAPALRPSEGGSELVFLRFMDHVEPGFVTFESVVLERAPSGTTMVDTRRSRLRAWTAAELVLLAADVFPSPQVFGGMTGEPYDGRSSSDLVLLLERPA